MEKLRSLIAALDHFDKAWAALPHSVSHFLGVEFPRLARAWNKMSPDERRGVVRQFATAQEAKLNFRLGFYETTPPQSDVESLTLVDRLRQERTLVGGILDGLDDADGAKPRSSSTLVPLTPGRRGRPAVLLEQVRAWLVDKHPDGPPADVTVESYLAALKADGFKVSATTISRALGRRSDADRSSKIRPE